jgi:hypothetical protein
MRNGLTYRQFSGGWSEANFTDGQTGKGVFADPGRNVWRARRPIEVFKHYKIAPGLLYQGGSVIGVYARSKSGVGRDLFLSPDQMTLDFMSYQAQNYDFTLVNSNYPSLVTLALRRFGLLPQGLAHYICLSGAPDNLNEELFAPTKGRNFTSSKHSVTFDGDNVTVKVRTHSRALLRPEEPDPVDTIEFTLDGHGALKGGPTKAFLPVIEVRSQKTGEIYLVDIRKLLYDDLSQILLPPGLTSSDHAVKKEINRQLNLLAIRVRNLNSGLEFGYTFAR